MMISDSAQLGQRATGEHSRLGHRQSPEAVDDASLEILSQPDSGGQTADQDRFDEDSGHDIIEIVNPRSPGQAQRHNHLNAMAISKMFTDGTLGFRSHRYMTTFRAPVSPALANTS
jgi:hypothetical protein